MVKNNKCKLNDISNYLVEKLKAKEITAEEFLSMNSNISDEELNNKSKIYKINDCNLIKSLLSENEKSELEITIDHLNKDIDGIDKSSYEYQISTGNLVVIILESEDGEHLSGFIMDGNGELLFNSLLELIGSDFEKSNNTLEDMIEELRRFKPYGTI
ncbi:hypothetical protein [Terrisporobacter glycolicus]|uniref:Uncharacterized protein n=1 Tax=Terrisporobacter glycolicus ATCC 14880 = DSM 1288 TaxID=1121315 RepID=A0ABZ2EQY1_9FIRM|nr:hypothetical protein [Terrisporobacter glycolicus]